MAKAAIVLDEWKLPAFRKVLDKAGYVYTVGPAPVAEAVTMYVEVDDIEALKPVVEKAQAEAAKEKMH